MSKINGNDSTMEALLKMSDGNPGAISVLMQIIEKAESIDPQGAMGGTGAVLMMDTCEIYGADIWMLYKDVCGEDLTKTIGILRACQLGIISRELLKTAISSYGKGIDVCEVMVDVRKKLDEFSKE